MGVGWGIPRKLPSKLATEAVQLARADCTVLSRASILPMGILVSEFSGNRTPDPKTALFVLVYLGENGYEGMIQRTSCLNPDMSASQAVQENSLSFYNATCNDIKYHQIIVLRFGNYRLERLSTVARASVSLPEISPVISNNSFSKLKP